MARFASLIVTHLQRFSLSVRHKRSCRDVEEARKGVIKQKLELVDREVNVKEQTELVSAVAVHKPCQPQ